MTSQRLTVAEVVDTGQVSPWGLEVGEEGGSGPCRDDQLVIGDDLTRGRGQSLGLEISGSHLGAGQVRDALVQEDGFEGTVIA